MVLKYFYFTGKHKIPSSFMKSLLSWIKCTWIISVTIHNIENRSCFKTNTLYLSTYTDFIQKCCACNSFFLTGTYKCNYYKLNQKYRISSMLLTQGDHFNA